MLRRLFTMASVISLLICAASAALWVWDRDSIEQIGWAVPVLEDNGQPTTVVDDGYSPDWLFAPEDRRPPRSPRTVILCNVYGLRVCRGTCALGVTEPPDWPEKPGWYHIRQPANRYVLRPAGRLGFGFAWSNVEARWLFMLWRREIFLPFWFITAITALLPALAATRMLLRHRRTHRKLTGRICIICGYDLRASKDRCPECGMPFTFNVERSQT